MKKRLFRKKGKADDNADKGEDKAKNASVGGGFWGNPNKIYGNSHTGHNKVNNEIPVIAHNHDSEGRAYQKDFPGEKEFCFLFPYAEKVFS